MLEKDFDQWNDKRSVNRAWINIEARHFRAGPLGAPRGNLITLL